MYFYYLIKLIIFMVLRFHFFWESCSGRKKFLALALLGFCSVPQSLKPGFHAQYRDHSRVFSSIIRRQILLSTLSSSRAVCLQELSHVNRVQGTGCTSEAIPAALMEGGHGNLLNTIFLVILHYIFSSAVFQVC